MQDEVTRSRLRAEPFLVPAREGPEQSPQRRGLELAPSEVLSPQQRRVQHRGDAPARGPRTRSSRGDCQQRTEVPELFPSQRFAGGVCWGAFSSSPRLLNGEIVTFAPPSYGTIRHSGERSL